MDPVNEPRVFLPVARVDLGCRWRWHPSALRGAVVVAMAQLAGGDDRLHSDWNGRLNAGEGETLSRIPPVCYRVAGDQAQLYLWGLRTAERLAELARLEWLVPPEGGPLPVALSVDLQQEAFAVEGRCWLRYESRSPWWPPLQAEQRKPKNAPDCVLRAWAAQRLLSGLYGVIRACGIVCEEGLRPVVQVEGIRPCPVVWHRDPKDLHHATTGYHLQFVSNVRVPDGFSLGKHVAEGYGELRRIDEWKIQG